MLQEENLYALIVKSKSYMSNDFSLKLSSGSTIPGGRRGLIPPSQNLPVFWTSYQSPEASYQDPFPSMVAFSL